MVPAQTQALFSQGIGFGDSAGDSDYRSEIDPLSTCWSGPATRAARGNSGQLKKKLDWSAGTRGDDTLATTGDRVTIDWRSRTRCVKFYCKQLQAEGNNTQYSAVVRGDVIPTIGDSPIREQGALGGFTLGVPKMPSAWRVWWQLYSQQAGDTCRSNMARIQSGDTSGLPECRCTPRTLAYPELLRRKYKGGRVHFHQSIIITVQETGIGIGNKDRRTDRAVGGIGVPPASRKVRFAPPALGPGFACCGMTQEKELKTLEQGGYTNKACTRTISGRHYSHVIVAQARHNYSQSSKPKFAPGSNCLGKITRVHPSRIPWMKWVVEVESFFGVRPGSAAWITVRMFGRNCSDLAIVAWPVAGADANAREKDLPHAIVRHERVKSEKPLFSFPSTAPTRRPPPHLPQNGAGRTPPRTEGRTASGDGRRRGEFEAHLLYKSIRNAEEDAKPGRTRGMGKKAKRIVVEYVRTGSGRRSSFHSDLRPRSLPRFLFNSAASNADLRV
ncbi:hypothetical protein B0H17DRAFT_1129655 [Mycena rosella]|uniref:Uncharacterized protein n=1 Tax=Mycena rosella TaxID=1033263 RepID=A0AAD7DV73_MYCRO|nr:hypothetical protein B0H17DRAFT_1129655 [Mycena rosella]